MIRTSTFSLAAAAGAGLALLVGSAASAAAPAPPAPAVTVSPAGGLDDGQTVTVAGSGFTAGKRFSVGQCEMDALYCNIAELVETTADANGTFQVTLPARKRYHGVNPKDHTEAMVDCASQPCSIAAVDPTDDSDDAEYAVSDQITFV